MPSLSSIFFKKQASNQELVQQVPQVQQQTAEEQQQQAMYMMQQEQQYDELIAEEQQQMPLQALQLEQQQMPLQALQQQSNTNNSNVQQMPKFKMQQRRRRRDSTGMIRKLFSAEEAASPASANAKLVSVVVTISSGSSYDELFCSVPQKVGEDERAVTYAAQQVDPAALQQLVEMGAMAPICQTQPDAAALVADLAAVEPASVVFNWECCDGCSGDSFCGASPVPLMAFLLARGYMVMVSDFSLGALIACWDAQLLGPNPFVKVGEFGESMALRFDAEALKACDDSAQLQVLGELCANGEAQVHALGGTKAYAVDPSLRDGVRVLSVVSALDGQPAAQFVGGDTRRLSEVGPHVGLAGHVIVDFAGGGRLLTACPHWIELSRLDADEAAVLAVAEERYGESYANELRCELRAMGDDGEGRRRRKEFSSVQASRFVQQSSAAKWVPSKRSAASKS